MAKRTRQYSRAFTPRQEPGQQFTISRIPTPLWRRVRAKARRDGISLRALILGNLASWVEGGTR